MPEPKKLTFMYLANDVIQNSKKKGPEYGKEFSNVLPKVFTHIGETCSSEKLLGSLGRILNIWQERGVYDPKAIADYRSRMNREGAASTAAASNGSKSGGESAAGHKHNHTSSSSSSGNSMSSSNNNNKSEKSEKREKRKHEERHMKSKRPRASHHQSISVESPVVEPENGHTPPYLPLGEPPEPEELIKALTSIENSASSDALVRERIAKLPPEISEISCISKLEDKDKAKVLAKQVCSI